MTIVRDTIGYLKYLWADKQFVELGYEDVLDQLSGLDKEQLTGGVNIMGNVPDSRSNINNYSFDDKSGSAVAEHVQKYFLPKDGQLFEALDIIGDRSGDEIHHINISVKDIVAECGDNQATRSERHVFPECRIKYVLKK